MLGILMLDTHFPRLPGDVGHPASWRMPARYRVVAGVSPRLVERCPHLRTLVLECTPMPPCAGAVQAATGLAVHPLMNFVHERWTALGPT